MADSSGRETHHVFDLIFKRLFQETSSRAVVSLVNGLFGTDFSLDSPVSFPNKEKVTGDLRKIISDMTVDVGTERFQFEAQIDDDLNMALRMFQYGYYEALDNPERDEDGRPVLVFPQARVLYWETTKKTPDMERITIVFPDRSRHEFRVPAFKVLEHEIAELEGMRVALLLPFYMLKYRKQVKAARTNEERQDLAPKVGETLKNLLDAVQELRESGILTREDEAAILGEVKILYSELYETYEEFREIKMTLEERLENPYFKMKREARAEGLAEGRAEVAWSLLKAGVSKDVIVQATGLSIADIERQSRTTTSAIGN
jgi:predicted transposase/invertase (TIGR01784 family)